MSRLRKNEMCPLHRRRDCCGRAEFNRYPQVKKQTHGIWTLVSPGRWRSADGREKLSKAQLRRKKDNLLRQNPVCAACGGTFTDYSEVELAHVDGKGIGGGSRDDSKVVLMHTLENREQGSRSLEEYLADPNRIALKKETPCETSSPSL